MTRSVAYEAGASFPYLGKEYTLEIRRYRSYARPGVMAEGNKLVVLTARTETSVIEEAVKNWYENRAKQVLTDRVEQYRRQLGETIGAVRIKNVKSRWGSCSSKRILNFNWRLVMAPPEILDYVVVHELCHLQQMNHSAAFWSLVEGILPDYKQRRDWLKTCGLIERYQ